MPDASTAITRIRLERFAEFESLILSPSPGVNAFPGANGTGKTHLMKVAYATCDARSSNARFPDKLARLFLPSNKNMGRLVKRRRGRSRAIAEDAQLLTRTDDMKRTLPGGTPVRWSRALAHDCLVFNIAKWNEVFPEYPISRHSAAGVPAS